ncbi:hypothetical protein, partial [Butyricicoccus sp.]|uniref:hypothetical protein n=1 Tax=Butyricicoccus sp. TaxID=2049021 RepID=UPI003F13A5AD
GIWIPAFWQHAAMDVSFGLGSAAFSSLRRLSEESGSAHSRLESNQLIRLPSGLAGAVFSVLHGKTTYFC